MHEFSLCEGIINQLSAANDSKLNDIDEVNVEIGRLANVDVDSLRFWFPVVAKTRLCPQIKLIVNLIDAVALCNSCNMQFSLSNLFDPCPNCNKFADYTIICGQELLLKSFQLI